MIELTTKININQHSLSNYSVAYKIVFDNGCVYFGATNDLKHRFIGHKTSLNKINNPMSKKALQLGCKIGELIILKKIRKVKWDNAYQRAASIEGKMIILNSYNDKLLNRKNLYYINLNK